MVATIKTGGGPHARLDTNLSIVDHTAGPLTLALRIVPPLFRPILCAGRLLGLGVLPHMLLCSLATFASAQRGTEQQMGGREDSGVRVSIPPAFS